VGEIEALAEWTVTQGLYLSNARDTLLKQSVFQRQKGVSSNQ
jgi:hypothetical protein